MIGDPMQRAVKMLALHLPAAPVTQPNVPRGTLGGRPTPEDLVLKRLMAVMQGPSAIPPATSDTTISALLEALTRGR